MLSLLVENENEYERVGRLIEEFSDQGVFWLPNDPDNAVSGTLKFSPDSGLDLSLVGSFKQKVPFLQSHFRVIHGRVRGKDLTLLDCLSAGGTQYGLSSMSYEDYRPRTALLGHALDVQPETHVEGTVVSDDSSLTTITPDDSGMPDWAPNDELCFDYARVELENLGAWARNPGLTLQTDLKRRGHFSLTYAQPEKDRAEFSRGELVLHYGYRSSGPADDGFRIDLLSSLVLQYRESQSLTQIFSDVGMLQNFLTLCLDRGCNLEKFYVGRTDIPVLSLADTVLAPRKEIEVLAQTSGYSPAGRKRSFVPQRDAVISYEAVGRIQTVAKWLDQAESIQLPLGSLMSIRYGRPLYVENRLLNTTFAAEAYHRIRFGGNQLEEETFDILCNLAINAMPPDRKEWMTGLLRYANSPTLRRRLHELGKLARPAIRETIGSIKDWEFAVSSVRNYLTHLDQRNTQFDGATLHWLSESVFSVMRICLLKDCGLEDAGLVDIGQTHALQFLGRRVKSAVADARETIEGLSSSAV